MNDIADILNQMNERYDAEINDDDFNFQGHGVKSKTGDEQIKGEESDDT